MKLSIIIPYHNADPWIGGMLDSLLDQDLPHDDYEIVVVDDGSTEEPVTLHRYAAQYPNITCHRQENAGVTMARNTGLGLVKGTWVWFCDADDYVLPQSLGRLLAIAEERRLDMLFFDARYVYPGKPVDNLRNDFAAVSDVRTGWEYAVNPPAPMGMAVWRFLVRRECLENPPLRFHDVTYGEGSWFQLELLPRVRRVAHVSVDIYFYVQRQGSILHAKKRKNFERYASDMYQYLTALTGRIDDASVPSDVRKLLVQRRDYEAYRLLGSLLRYCPADLSRSYLDKLAAMGAWPLARSGGRSERLYRRLMNRRGLWLAACRLYRRLRPVAAGILSLAVAVSLAAGCGPRIVPGAGGMLEVRSAEPVDVASLVLRDVPNEVFYKDVFLDAGIGLTSRTFLYAADSMDLSLEGISLSRSNASEAEKALQQRIIAGDSLDWNGRLLYPDGQPRYRVLFVNGGSSTTHGKSLGETALQRMRTFVANGGSYVGTCAGAFFASRGTNSNPENPYYLAVWPGIAHRTEMKSVYSGVRIEAGSPLLAYDDFGGDGYVNSVRHNLGCYAGNLPDGTEVLARFDYPARKDVHQQPLAWAYKQDERTGRVVMESSHPEEVSKGERLAFTESLIGYACDGVGVVPLKGVLANGEPCVMDRQTWEDDPAHTRIGDLQCHHFAVYVPADAVQVRFTVESDADCDLLLRLRRDGYAFPSREDYATDGSCAWQQLAFDTLASGVWYVSVQCLTTVTVTNTDYGQAYSGRTDVLNGMPYTITVSWLRNE